MSVTERRKKIVREFASVINRNSLEQDSGTPDFILAEYLVFCLENWNQCHKERAIWWDKLSAAKAGVEQIIKDDDTTGI